MQCACSELHAHTCAHTHMCPACQDSTPLHAQMHAYVAVCMCGDADTRHACAHVGILRTHACTRGVHQCLLHNPRCALCLCPPAWGNVQQCAPFTRYARMVYTNRGSLSLGHAMPRHAMRGVHLAPPHHASCTPRGVTPCMVYTAWCADTTMV